MEGWHILVRNNNKSLQYSLQSTCLQRGQLEMREQAKNSARKFKIFPSCKQQQIGGWPLPQRFNHSEKINAVVYRANSLPSTSNAMKQTKTRFKIFDSFNTNKRDQSSQPLLPTKRRSMFEKNTTKPQLHQNRNEPVNQQARKKQKFEHHKYQRIKTQSINLEKAQKLHVLYTFCETQIEKRLVAQPLDKNSRHSSSKTIKKDDILKPTQFAQMVHQIRMHSSHNRKKHPNQVLKWVSESPLPVQKGKGLRL